MTSTRPVFGIDRELHVRAAGLDADLVHDRARRVAQALVLVVGERHRRRDRDRVAGVHAHRIDVLDRADDDEVVRAVADDLELELLPAEHALFDEHLAWSATAAAPRRPSRRAPPGSSTMPPPEPPMREARPQDHRVAGHLSTISRASSTRVRVARARGTRGRQLLIASLKSWRSSALRMASTCAPISSTP